MFRPTISLSLKILTALVLLACPCFGQMTLTGAGGTRAVAGLPGPPTFTWTDTQGETGSGTGPFTATGNIGTASPTRRVYALITDVDSTAAISGTPTIGGVNCDVIYTPTSGTNQTLFILSAVVPTGTTATVSFNLVASGTGVNPVHFWTTDKTTLSSPTPYTSSVNNLSGGTSASGSLSGVTSGSAVMMGFVAFGINNGSQNISSSTPTMTQEGATFSATMTGIANNNTAGSQSVTVSWTATASGGSIILAAVR